MIELAKIARDFTPGAAGVWTLVIMFGAYLLREWRETRRLSFEDREARRAGYSKQVEELQIENRKLRDDTARAWAEHTEYRRLCHEETDQLRREVAALSDELHGLRRAIAAGQVSTARILPPGTLSDQASAAGDRAAGFAEGKESHERD